MNASSPRLRTLVLSLLVPAAAGTAFGGGFSLTNELAVLSLDARGWSTQLVERATGRVLVTGTVPFVRPLINGQLQVSTSVEPRGKDAWAWKYGKTPGEIVVGLTPFAGGWTFEVRAVTLAEVRELRLCCLRGVACRQYTSQLAQTTSDDRSGIAVRGYDLHAVSATGSDMSALLRADDAPLVGRKVGFAAGPRAAFIQALQAMTVAAGVPHSNAGGAWALSSEQCRGSYMNINVTEAKVDDAIALALRGGFDVVHFREHWYACRGHYPVNTNDWPSGLAGMKAAVARIHAAGLRAGLHTLSGCIDPRDSWITPRCSSNLMAWATYTLAEPLTAASRELVVEERPIDRHDVTFTYHGNGNAIRIGEEIVQYTGVRREKPYAFTGLTRGAFRTVVSDHAKGDRADYLQQRYIAFYPEPDSALARDLADAIGHVYRTCGFDQIYCDGIEGMHTRYGMAKMRHLIIGACTRDGHPCLNEDSASGCIPSCWWFHSRVGAWDSTYWAPKRFHDFHVGNMHRRKARERDLREIQMGWWSPVQWSIHARPHCADEMEYYAGKNAALDASMSVGANLKQGPLNFGTLRQWTILGWYENFRRAGAFADGVAEKLAVPRAEFRLRQDDDGVWRMASAVCRRQRVHSASAAQWRVATDAAPEDGGLRIEALYAGEPFDAPTALTVLAPADVPTLVATNAPAVRGRVMAEEDPERGQVLRFRAENGGVTTTGAWASVSHEFRPYRKIGNRRVLACWVKGDGSGAILNVQVMTPREYGLCYSEHYVKLDFTGWRYMEMPFRETDAETFCDYKWPYSGGYAEVFHRVINMDNVSAVRLYLNAVPPGGAAEAVVSDIRLVPMREAGCRHPAVTVNGKTFVAPFELKSGEFAEYGKGFWTHLDKFRTPIARVAATEKIPLVAGDNALSYSAEALTSGTWPRAEVNVFTFGKKFPALRDLSTLPPARRRLLDYEATEPCRYAPAQGFAEVPPLVTRPGETARATFEVTGPIGAFEVSIGGVAQKFPAVAEKETLRVPPETFPAFTGTVPVTVRADDPSAARATFSFIKRYSREELRFIAVPGATPNGGSNVCDTARFVKAFDCAKEIRRATWTLSGLGIFRAYLNGREVGAEDFLKPGLTHVLKRRHSFAYDVTSFLRPGRNVLAAEVSTGWWRDGVVRSRGVKPATKSGFGGMLEIEHVDGSRTILPTDTSWGASYGGNLVHAEIYWGETYDARVDAAWRTSDTANWPRAEKYADFAGVVTPVEGPTIKLRRDLALTPKEIYVWKGVDGATDAAFGRAKVLRRYEAGERIVLEPGETLVVDFAQNAAGVPEFTASAAVGTELMGHPAEMLNDANGEKIRGNDGPAGSTYIANYRTARTTMTYVFAGTGNETHLPHFTFFGGRYFSFTANGKVAISSLRFIPVMSIAPEDETGTIVTGHEGLNRLIANCTWGMRSNYLSVPTDCPQRNERLGWAGDTQAFVGAAVYAADVYGFLSKWMTDMRDSQMDERDKFPGSFRRAAPMGPAGFLGYMIGWSDAGVIVPYTLWRHFGDTAVVKENWAAMCRFMALLNRTNYVTPPDESQCADWLSAERYESWRIRSGSVLWPGETQGDMRAYWDMLGSCYHVWDLRMMREMARAIGEVQSAKAFEAREKIAVRRYRNLFLDADGRLAERYRDMQTPVLYPLWLDLFPTAAATATAKADLVASLKRGNFKVRTGFLGTPILLDVLADVVNEPSLAYSVLLQRDCPGWLYSVDQGATTIWERWDGYTKERGFGPVAMNSFNHYAYGAVMGWMYRTMAGIRPGQQGGFRRFALAPKPDRRVGSCAATFRTKQGLVKSAWKYGADGSLEWSFTVPPGTCATVTPPGGRHLDYGPGDHVLSIAP